MAIEYLGLSSVEGPLVVLEGVQDAFYDEIVEFVVDHKTKKMGRIVELNEDKAIIQVFEGTENMSLDNTHTRLMGRPMEVTVSPEKIGSFCPRISVVRPSMAEIPVWAVILMKISQLCLELWELSMTWQISSARHLMRTEYPTMCVCS